MSSATVTHRPAGHFTVDAGGQRRRIPWRQIHEIGSAAFWIDQTTRSQLPTRHALGNGLREEFTACILGGFGIRGAMTLAAFHAVRDAGLLADGVEPTAVDLEEVLRTPLSVPGHTRPIRYRFARQRAHRISVGLNMLAELRPTAHTSGRDFRDELLALPGVGMKTASWIARNTCNSDDLAVIDIHVHRAGVVAEVFDRSWTVQRHYRSLRTPSAPGHRPAACGQPTWTRACGTRWPTSPAWAGPDWIPPTRSAERFRPGSACCSRTLLDPV